MRVLIIEFCKELYAADIPNTLEALQEAVGGDIETVPAEVGDEVLAICNEEGKILNLPPNRFVYDNDGLPYDILAGTFVLCRDGGEEFASLTPEQEAKYMMRYSHEMILDVQRSTPANHNHER